MEGGWCNIDKQCDDTQLLKCKQFCRCEINKQIDSVTKKCATAYPYNEYYNKDEVNSLAVKSTSGYFLSVLNNKIAIWSIAYSLSERTYYAINITAKIWKTIDTNAVRVISATYNNSEIYAVLAYPDGSSKIGKTKENVAWTYFNQNINNFNSMVINKDEVFVSSSSFITIYSSVGIKIKSIETKSQISCIQVQSLNSDKRIFSGNKDGKIQVWLKSNFSLIQVLDYTSSVTVLQLDKFETKLASGHSNSMINIWNSSTGELIKTLSGHSSEITALTFLNKEKYLASGSKDGSIKIWDLEKLVLLDTLPPHGASVLSLATLSPGHLISGSSDKTLRVWRYEY